MKNEKNGKLQVPYLLFMLVKASMSSNVRSECLNYQILSNETRSVGYFSASLQCDDGLATGWYRFMGKAGTQLPEQPIMDPISSPFRCSTHATSWMTKPHPSIWEGKVERAVCFRWGWTRCLGSSIQTFVINCGSYFVYYLQRTPACYYRYCGSAKSHEGGKLCQAKEVHKFMLSNIYHHPVSIMQQFLINCRICNTMV